MPKHSASDLGTEELVGMPNALGVSFRDRHPDVHAAPASTWIDAVELVGLFRQTGFSQHPSPKGPVIMDRYDVVSPEGVPVRPKAAPRRALTDLNTATLAELWDDRFYGDEIFTTVRQELRRRYPGITIIEHGVFGNTHGFDEDVNIGRLPERLAALGCDGALSAVGA